jgi:hypothetical protein
MTYGIIRQMLIIVYKRNRRRLIPGTWPKRLVDMQE